MNRQPAAIYTLFVLGCLLVLLACNLTDSPEPPTIVPRATATPPPTIGYATLAPDQYPQQATQIVSNNVSSDTTLLNLLNQVDADRLFAHIDALVGMRTRHVNSSTVSTTEGIGAATNYVINQFYTIRDQSFQNSFSVSTQDFAIDWEGKHSIGRNIIGVLSGTEVGGGVIVLGAHYDSISYSYSDPSAYAPGANDDASGIAALIEIARIMSQRRHRATIMFVAFSAEEIQRKGSVTFVNDYLRANNINVTAMLNMDIIGSQTGPNGDINNREIRMYSADPNESRSRQLARALHLITSRLAPNMKINVQGSVDREGRYSDHMSFSEAGYPAVRFIEALEDPSRQHSDRDTIDDIQASYLVPATQTILASMIALADGPPPPQNISLRAASGDLRTLVWERVPGAVSYIVALRAPGSLTYTDYFEIADISVTWRGFVASSYTSLAVASKDENGVIGMFSQEYGIGS